MSSIRRASPDLTEQLRRMQLDGERIPLLSGSDDSAPLLSTMLRLTRCAQAMFAGKQEDEMPLLPLSDFAEEEDVMQGHHAIVCPGVKVLDLSDRSTISVQELEDLKSRFPDIESAKFLNITYQDLKEVVSCWPKLTQLSLRHSGLTDEMLKLVSQLSDLHYLELDYLSMSVTDKGWESIACLKKLQTLVVTHCRMTDASFKEMLKHCRTLKVLLLDSCPGLSSQVVEDIAFLKHLTSLKVCLKKPNKGSLKLWKNLTQLRELGIFSDWRDIHLLKVFRELRSLSISYCSIKDEEIVEILPQLPYLEKLTFSCHNVGNETVKAIGAYAACAKIHYLDLSGCLKITDIHPLSSLKNLRHFNIARCVKIVDLQVLRAFKELEFLSLERCQGLEDFSPLASLMRVRRLNISFCFQIKDNVAFIRDLPQLKYLDAIQTFYEYPLDLGHIPIESDCFQQLMISQDDQLKKDSGFERFQHKITKVDVPSSQRDYV